MIERVEKVGAEQSGPKSASPQLHGLVEIGHGVSDVSEVDLS
jgi:hypothetical protein